jgi:hypothetical protein
MRPVVLAALLLSLLVSPAYASSASVRGGDISWPNCPKGMGVPERPSEGQPMPLDAARFVIVGLTNGLGFTRNPCLGAQVSWAREHQRSLGAYAVLTYPTPPQLAKYGGHGSGGQRLFRAGAGEANANVRTALRVGLRTPTIWIDVEPVRLRPWSAVPARNNAVLDGAAAAYRQAGWRVGIYSYAYGWPQPLDDSDLGSVRGRSTGLGTAAVRSAQLQWRAGRAGAVDGRSARS